MKFAIIFAALFAVAIAHPAGEVQIVRDQSNVEPEKFDFGFETSDGTRHDAAGVLRDVGTDHEDQEVAGSFSFVGDDGRTYRVDYTAGINGFIATGDHLPKAP